MQFRERTYDPITQVKRVGGEPDKRLTTGDEVVLYLEDDQERKNDIYVKIATIEGNIVEGEVSRPTRLAVKEQLDKGTQLAFKERNIFRWARE